ncbi:hypothetical protein ADL01_10675, partial [Streptomyces sp. NRRL WC-3618]
MPDRSGSGVVGTKGADTTTALTLRAEGHTGRDTPIRAHDEAPYRQGPPHSRAAVPGIGPWALVLMTA